MAIYKGAAYCVRNEAGGSRYFRIGLTSVADASTVGDDPADWDHSESTSIAFQWTSETSGLTPPGSPDSIEFTLYDANSTTVVIDSVTFNSPGTGGIVTMNPTSDGSSTGGPVIGDMRLRIRAVRTSVGTYDINSDDQNTKGVIRVNPTSATFTLTHDGVTDPASLLDFVKFEADHSARYRTTNNKTYNLEYIKDGTTTLFANRFAYGTSSFNAISDRSTQVDKAFPKEPFNLTVDFSVATSTIAPDSEPSATWIVLPTGSPTSVGPIPVDAGIDVHHHMQANDSVINPTLDIANKQRLNADLGFVGFRLLNARGEGINAMETIQTLQDNNNLVAPVINRTVTTTTVNGEDGWSPSLAAWDSQLPGGSWTHQVDVQTYAGVDMEVNPTETFTLLAINPNYAVIVGGGHTDAVNQPEHWRPGDDLLVGVALFDRTKGTLTPVQDGTGGTTAPYVVIGRFNVTFGVAQYLESDFTWVNLSSTAEAYRWPLAQSAGDPNVWIMTIAGANTTTWNPSSLYFLGNVAVGGTPYAGIAEMDILGSSSPHGKQYEVLTGGGPTDKAEHWSPGMPFQAGLSVMDMENASLVAVDGFKEIAVFRLQDGGLNAGYGEYLEADGVTWTPLTGAETIYFHPVTETRPGSSIYTKTWSDTSSWGNYDIFTLGRVKVGLFEFHNYLKEPGVGVANKHGGYKFDGAGFLGFPSK